MHNTLVICIYIPFLLISVVIFILESIQSYRNKRSIMFALMCFCVIGWFSCEIIPLLVGNIPENSFVWNIGFIFIAFASLTMFLFVLEFYRPNYKPPPALMVLIVAIPVINMAMVFTSEHHLLIRRVIINSIWPVRDIVSIWGPWFWVHTVYCYVLSLSIMGIIIFGHSHMPKFYRLSSTMMIFGIILVLSSNIVTLTGSMPINMDPTVIAVSIAILFLHLALISNDQSIFVRFSRGQVFRYLDEYILVLGENGLVADFNPGAQNWFSSIGIDINSCTLQNITDALLQKGAVIKETPENNDGMDIYFRDGDFPRILNFRKHNMNDERENIIGAIAIFTDVTQNRIMLEQLEAKAGIDPLTGIANRMAYEGAKKRLDSPQYIPLSVIMCDVNGLKEVNDTLGHKYGDMMLRVLAEVLEAECPKGSFVSRIGGDEFIYFLPNTGTDDSHALMRKINTALSKLENLPFIVSASLGAATKHSEKENLDDVIILADSRMYHNKKRFKETQG